MTTTMIDHIELHNSGSRMRKRCRYRFVLQDVQGWRPKKRSAALYVGTGIDRALKSYYGFQARTMTFAKDVTLEPLLQYHSATEASWATLEAYIEGSRLPDLDDAVTQEFETLAAQMRAMWTIYLDRAVKNDENREVIIVGRQFRGLIRMYDSPELGSIPLYYGGELDGLSLYNGMLYVDENKTSVNIRQLTDSLDRDEQASRYQWAVQRMVDAGALEELGIAKGTHVFGTVYNILNKRTSVPIQINQDGSISKVAKRNHYDDYILALLNQNRIYVGPGSEKRPGKRGKMDIVQELVSAPGVSVLTTPALRDIFPPDAGGYSTINPYISPDRLEEWNEQHVPALMRLRELEWVKRVVTDRNPTTLQIIEEQLFWEALEELDLRMHPEKAFRNPTWACAIDCPVLDVCTADLNGEPVQGLLEEFYTNERGTFEVIDDSEEEYDPENVGF